MHEATWIRWYMVGFFVLYGLWLIVKRQRFASAGSFCCGLCLDQPMQQRLVLAYQRREQLEGLPSSRMGAILGGLSLLMAVLATITQVPVVVLYAANVVALAAILTFTYTHLRQLTKRRVATLQLRDPNTIAPWYAWTLVSTTVVLPLLWLPSAPVASCLVTAAGVAIAVLARQVASMPALLSGDDVAVEAFVDARLRKVRAFNLLSTAIAPGFVFEAFTGYLDSAAHAAAMAFGLLTLTVMIWMQIRLLRRRPSQADIRKWHHAAP